MLARKLAAALAMAIAALWTVSSARAAETQSAKTQSAKTQAAKTQLTIVSWGGAYSAAQHKAFHAPYMAANPGVGIVIDESSREAVEKLRAMDEAGSLAWDLVDVTAADAIRLCDEGLAMKIDHDKALAPAPDGTPPSKDFGLRIISDCFIPQVVYSTAVGYRTDKLRKPPKSICALFDVKTYPGKRALESEPFSNLEWALLCDGVPKDEIYPLLETPEGVRRALLKLETIREHIVWWRSASEAVDLLARGKVVMASAYNGRLFSLINEKKAPVGMLWDGQVFDLDGWIVPKGLSKRKLAAVMGYLRFATDPQRLADLARHIAYGPARSSSLPLVSTHATLGVEMAPHMPNSPANAKNSFLTNYEWWAEHRDDLDVRFRAWLAQ